MQGDWDICKIGVAHRQAFVAPITTKLSKTNKPMPKEYKRTRNTTKIDNFL